MGSLEAPRCCGDRMIPIVYGMPDAKLIEASQRGEAKIGGCVIHDDMPLFVCRRCGLTEGRLGDDSKHFERDDRA